MPEGNELRIWVGSWISGLITVTRYDISHKVFKGSGIIFEPSFIPCIKLQHLFYTVNLNEILSWIYFTLITLSGNKFW